MTEFEPRFIAFATEHLIKAAKSLIERALEQPVEEPDETTEESTNDQSWDVIRALREECGNKLLAKDAEIEGLQKQVRGMTRVLQMCYQAHDTLYDALYVSGKREMG